MNRADKLRMLESRPTLTPTEAQWLAERWKTSQPFKKCLFDLVGPEGRKGAYWLDAYMGFFSLDELEGKFMTVSSLEYLPVHIENMRLEEDEHD